MKACFYQKFVKAEEGQAIIEYILMLAIALSLVITLTVAFRKFIMTLWQVFSCEVSAGCPSCRPDEAIKNKISRGCK